MRMDSPPGGGSVDTASLSTAISTTNSTAVVLSTSTSTGLSTLTSGLTSLSTSTSTGINSLSTALSTTNSTAVVLSTSASTGFSLRKPLLAATLDLYVATTGSDSNNGTSVGTPFLTLTKALTVAATYDLSVYGVHIHIADGDYSAEGGWYWDSAPGCSVDGNNLTITGNTTTPANVVIGDPSVRVGFVLLQGVKTTSINANYATANISMANCQCVYAYASGGYIFAQVANTFAGNEWAAIGVENRGRFRATGTITVSGTPAYSDGFVWAETDAIVDLASATISGSSTGKRFVGAKAATIYAPGTGFTGLPGNADGTLATGAQYNSTAALNNMISLPVTVANLPAASTQLKGTRATATDATATTFMSTVAGGGANIVPVFCDGTNWLIG